MNYFSNIFFEENIDFRSAPFKTSVDVLFFGKKNTFFQIVAYTTFNGEFLSAQLKHSIHSDYYQL